MADIVAQSPLALKTIDQEAMMTAGQRRVNLIWETTQASIAVVVVLANMIVAVYQGLAGAPDFRHPAALSNTLFLVVGFYFSRTNHEKIGGIGVKPQADKYEGR